MSEKENNNKNVSWTIFAWIIAVIVVVFGWIFNAIAEIDTKVSNYNVSIGEIQTQLSQIQADLVWIKLNLK